MSEDKVAYCERLVFNVLDQVFRRWALPAELVAQRDAIHAGWHFWLGCRYAMGGLWDDVARSLTRVVALRPAWRHDPTPLLDLLVEDALTPRVRVAHPVRLVEGVLDHLPPALDLLRLQRAHTLGRVLVGLALRAHAAAERVAARRFLAAAVVGDPDLAARPARFATELARHARRLAPEDRERFVERVLDDLPMPARPLARARSRALADLAVAAALETAGRDGSRRAAARAALRALRYRPALLVRAPAHYLGAVARRLRADRGDRRVADA
jgi:hypothetical protein